MMRRNFWPILLLLLAVGAILYFCTGCNSTKQQLRQDKRARIKMEKQRAKSPKVAAEFCRDNFPVTTIKDSFRWGATLKPATKNFLDTGAFNGIDTGLLHFTGKPGVFTMPIGIGGSTSTQICFGSKKLLINYFKQMVADGSLKLPCPDCPEIRAPDTIFKTALDPAPLKAAVIEGQQYRDRATASEATTKQVNKWLLISASLNIIQLIALVVLLVKKMKTLS